MREALMTWISAPFVMARMPTTLSHVAVRASGTTLDEAGRWVEANVAADEKVGILAMSAGRVVVVEYTELGDEDRYASDDRGELVYWAGNLAIHLFSLPFIRRVAADADRCLPYHLSAKKILEQATKKSATSKPASSE